MSVLLITYRHYEHRQLVCVIVGSGIMGDNLSADDGVALLGNTLATWGILFVLITVFGPVSGAHFNPVVSLCFYLKKELEVVRVCMSVLSLSRTVTFISLQYLGTVLYVSDRTILGRNFGCDHCKWNVRS